MNSLYALSSGKEGMGGVRAAGDFWRCAAPSAISMGHTENWPAEARRAKVLR